MGSRVDLGVADQKGWMQTYTGRAILPLEPDPEQIVIEDIAGPLSKCCRYGGHCLRFYSVAEHCVLPLQELAPEHRLSYLMHDAAEAYIGDMIRPLKAKIPQYYEAEDRLMTIIAKRFNFTYPLPKEVTEMDLRMLRVERWQNMAHMEVTPDKWGDVLDGPHLKLQFWPPERAYHEFITAFYDSPRHS